MKIVQANLHPPRDVVDRAAAAVLTASETCHNAGEYLDQLTTFEQDRALFELLSTGSEEARKAAVGVVKSMLDVCVRNEDSFEVLTLYLHGFSIILTDVLHATDEEMNEFAEYLRDGLGVFMEELKEREMMDRDARAALTALHM